LKLSGAVLILCPLQPHAITPSQDYFFAAGLDNRIRGWSLLTGEPLTHPHQIPEVTSKPQAVDIEVSPFDVKFEEQITSLEVIKAEHELCLFATSGPALHRFILGRRFPFET
jgi:WD repeat-containing protein 21A